MTPPVVGPRLNAGTGQLANPKMPELPEVEIARRTLERWLGASEVTGAEADRTRIFRGGGRKLFSGLRGRLLRAERHLDVLSAEQRVEQRATGRAERDPSGRADEVRQR